MMRETIVYEHGNVTFEGYAVCEFDEGYLQKPIILIAHAWRGLDDFAKNKAEQLAKLGYFAFAMDVYGKGVLAKDDAESAALMKPLFADRPLLLGRVLAAIDAIKNHEHADKTRIGAIGFCFGGLTVLDLAKSGTPDIKGVVSFHGLLGNRLGDIKAKEIKTVTPIHTKILVLHGYKDPMTSQEDIVNFQKSMTEAHADWQMTTYANGQHAFMNPVANQPSKGLSYDPVIERRAWISMINFFQEIIPV